MFQHTYRLMVICLPDLGIVDGERDSNGNGSVSCRAVHHVVENGEVRIVKSVDSL